MILIALRHIRRNKLYSVINIFCLAAGIAVTMTILPYVLYEHSYDKWHAGSDRIFCLNTPSNFGSESFVNDRVTYITGESARSSSAVEGMVRLMPAYLGMELQNPAMPQARFRENEHFWFADSNFFFFFSFRLLRGRPADVLAQPFSVVLLAILIASPLSWWIMHKWLEDFAYRTVISWWVFATVGLGLLLVALVTLLTRSLRAGRANPIDNLRSE